MEIDWKKKRIHYNNGTYVYFGLKRKRFWFKNKQELEMNLALVSHLEDRIESMKKVQEDQRKFIVNLQEYLMATQKRHNEREHRYFESVNADGILRKFKRYKDDNSIEEIFE